MSTKQDSPSAAKRKPLTDDPALEDAQDAGEGGEGGPQSESDWELDQPHPSHRGDGGGDGDAGVDDARGAGDEGGGGPGELPPGSLEEGHIYFFYKPKVQQTQPQSLDDISRFFIVLQPTARRPPPTSRQELAATAVAPEAAAAAGDQEQGQQQQQQQHTQPVGAGAGRQGVPAGFGSESVAEGDDKAGGGAGGGDAKEGGDGGKGATTSHMDSANEVKQEPEGDPPQGDREAGQEGAGGHSEAGGEDTSGSGGGGNPPGALPCRLIVVGKKRLPRASIHERFFGFVDAVADTLDELTAGMGETHYSTRTRGERTQPAARVAGRGTYSLLLRLHGTHRRHTELAYVLQLPQQPGPVQEELAIAPSARYVITIKNPTNKLPGRPSAGPEPAYSAAQLEAFAGGTLWVGAEDVSLLDVPGTELLLVGARSQPLEEVGEAAAQHLLDTHTREMENAEAEASRVKPIIKEEAEAAGTEVPGPDNAQGPLAAGAAKVEGDAGDLGGSEKVGGGGGDEEGGEDVKQHAREVHQAKRRQAKGPQEASGMTKRLKAEEDTEGKDGDTRDMKSEVDNGAMEVLTAKLKEEVAAEVREEPDAESGQRLLTSPAETGEWA